MTTFLEMVQAQGFGSISEYLDSMRDYPVLSDISASRLERIRQNEALTEHFLGGVAC